MKKILLLILIPLVGVGQTNNCIQYYDFANSYEDWTPGNSGDCNLNWLIGENLECQGNYPIAPINSENGWYALLDSDNLGNNDGSDCGLENSYITTSESINLSEFENVVIEFDTYYRSFEEEKCWLVLSTDGVNWPSLSPDSLENPSEGIYEVFPNISPIENTSLEDNPTLKRFDVSEFAGGNSEVWIRFQWTGIYGYAWFIDNVCIKERQEHEVAIKHINVNQLGDLGEGEQYGRIPSSVISALEEDFPSNASDIYAQFTNTGYNNIENCELEIEILEPGMESPNIYIYNLDDLPPSLDSVYVYKLVSNHTFGYDVGLCDITVRLVECQDSTGGAVSPVDLNMMSDSKTSTFEISTDYGGLYSLDFIDINDDIEIDRIGSDDNLGGDGVMMLNTYYVSKQDLFGVAGISILLDSYLYDNPTSVQGGEIQGKLVYANEFDYSWVDPDISDSWNEAQNEIFSNVIFETEYILIDEEDISNGSVFLPFEAAQANQVDWLPDTLLKVFAVINIYSNELNNPIIILDDRSSYQNPEASLIMTDELDIDDTPNPSCLAIRLFISGNLSEGFGCTIAESCNYDSSAVIDDGSCILDDDDSVAPFGCVDAVDQFGCDYLWGSETIANLCPVSCECEGFEITDLTESLKNVKNLTRKVDVLGRTTTNKGFELEIFDDGSVEKKYVIK